VTRLHHLQLGVTPDRVGAEAAFLTGILGYRNVEPSEQEKSLGARFFETDDGTQVHLSVDPDFQPAPRAHTSLEIGTELQTVATRLSAASIEFKDVEIDGRRILFCRDPAGNGWELRS
jgi:catechol 2,3-dioxygenase-like lactoylglutathione lyase family enzyme